MKHLLSLLAILLLLAACGDSSTTDDGAQPSDTATQVDTSGDAGDNTDTSTGDATDVARADVDRDATGADTSTVGDDVADAGDTGLVTDDATDDADAPAEMGTDIALDVANARPTASANPEVYGLVGSFTILSGSGDDANEEDLSLMWTQTAGPDVDLDDPTAASPMFVAPFAGVYEFSLVASDASEDSEPASSTAFIHDIDGGEEFTIALRPDGSLWAWGNNTSGQLGIGTADLGVQYPMEICTADGNDCEAAPFDDLVAVSAGRAHTLALTGSGEVYAWGANGSGQIGNDDTAGTVMVPTRVCAPAPVGCDGALSDVVAIAAGYLFSLALTADGDVYAWGWNSQGQAGIGVTSSNEPVPVRVHICVAEDINCDTDVPLTNVELISAGGGGHSMALTAGGTLYGWGHNKAGQIGINTTNVIVSLATPVCTAEMLEPEGCQDTPFTDVIAVDVWSGNSFALRSDRTLWGWGGNDSFQLGVATDLVCPSGSQCTRTPLGVCPDAECGATFDDVVSFEAGRRFTAAVSSTGSIWTWGDSQFDQLGQNVDEDVPHPARVCAVGDDCATFLDNVVAVAAGNYHAMALTTDGELLSWGWNQFGQVGNERFANVVYPTVVEGYADDPIPPTSTEGPCESQTSQPFSSCGGVAPTQLCVNANPCVNLFDDAYDGTLESMRCESVPVRPLGNLTGDLEVGISLEHTGVGDLVIKLVHPDGTVVPLLSRPGLTEMADDGSEDSVATGDLTASADLTFVTGADDAETSMNDEVVCDSMCSFAPSGDGALPDNDFATLVGKSIGGTWQVCVGDAGVVGVGGITRVSISLSYE